MNKTAIKNFAIWARNKLIADITYKAGLLGITEKEIKNPLPQSTQSVQFFDIGTKEPYAITGNEIKQRKKLVEEIQRSTSQGDYHIAFKNVIEEVAYTWFNRLIAVRFMEVNDYLPKGVRVLSSESSNKAEPDLVTHPMEADMDYTAFEKDRIMQLKQENKLDELFRMLFIKQCNALNENLPGLFEKTTDYTELLLNVTFTDKDGVVYHLVNDIPEDDFNVSKEGQVEIIGWLYQYYNTEPKDETFALLKKNVKITKERVPSATQLFTPDWIVRYMVENSLGRLWIEGHPNDELKSNWKYYLDEAEQEEDVQKQLNKIREEYKTIEPEDIKVIDPAMGSGHILVYAFDVLMKIYESYGYSRQDAAKSIVEKNIYGLDIDNRAYQLAYFAVMMKARQYNKKILNEETTCHVYSIQESNDINRNHLKYFGAGMSDIEKNTAIVQIEGLPDTFVDAEEYGSILNVDSYDWDLLHHFVDSADESGQVSLETIGIEATKEQLKEIANIGEVMARRYDVVVTNPPYIGGRNMNNCLLDYIVNNYVEGKADLFSAFIIKCGTMLNQHGFRAMITQHSWMFLSSFEALRAREMLNEIVNMAHLGPRAFEEIGGEVVQTVAWVSRNGNTPDYLGTYLRLVSYSNQKEKELAFLRKNGLVLSKMEHFSKIPGNTFAYWLRNAEIFTKGKPMEQVANPRQGLKTLDNEHYIRFWHEISIENLCLSANNAEEAIASKRKWFPINHGGEYRQYYGNNYCVVNWFNDGAEMKSNAIKKYNSITRTITNIAYYFREGITWSVLCSEPSFRRYNNGFIFSNGGQCVVPDEDVDLDYLTGLLNSRITSYILNVLSPTLGFESGYVKKLPVLKDELLSTKASKLSRECVEIAKIDWDTFEVSWDFLVHPLVPRLSYNCLLLKNVFSDWEKDCDDRFAQMKDNKEEMNRDFIEIYGLSSDLSAEVEDKEITIRKADVTSDVKNFISYAVGCMFGRYSLDKDGLAYAGGNWDESNYSTFIPDQDNIIPITDEEYFRDDIVGLFIAFIKKVYGDETLEENLDFIANALNNKGNSSREIIRNYFTKDFFKDHCKVYQKRPIYWLFDSGKENGFKALVYMHRYDENTIGNLRIDYLHRMQRIYENEIVRMQETIHNSKDAREVTLATKRKEKLIKQLKETKEYDEKIAHLALARTAIDLDDGVKVNYEKVQTDVAGKKLEVMAKI